MTVGPDSQGAPKYRITGAGAAAALLLGIPAATLASTFVQLVCLILQSGLSTTGLLKVSVSIFSYFLYATAILAATGIPLWLVLHAFKLRGWRSAVGLSLSLTVLVFEPVSTALERVQGYAPEAGYYLHQHLTLRGYLAVIDCCSPMLIVGVVTGLVFWYLAYARPTASTPGMVLQAA